MEDQQDEKCSGSRETVEPSNELNSSIDVSSSSNNTSAKMVLAEETQTNVREDVKRRQNDGEFVGEDGVGSSIPSIDCSKRLKSSLESHNMPSCSLSSVFNNVTSSSSTRPDDPSDQKSVSSMLANIPSSPPRFVAIEEVMKAANGVANMFLAHEIAVDGEFSLRKDVPGKRNLRSQIEEVMKKAFWDVLQSQLDETPPKYKQALSLLAEIKDDLNSLLLPQHTRLKAEIEEILDIELIKQQAENGTLDFNRYAQYVLSVMARLCAPVRDSRIRDLTQTSEVVPLFRGIMELLELMKLDMTNFTIEQLRPHIQKQSVEYERSKFKEFLETQSKFAVGEEQLQYTRKWLDRNYKALDLSDEPAFKALSNKVLSAAFIELLTWDDSKQEMFPETLLMDQSRFDELKEKVTLLTLLGSIFLLTLANIGSNFQHLDDLKQKLKADLTVILNDLSMEQEAKLDSCSLLVTEEIKKRSSTDEFDADKMNCLRMQIKALNERDNRVRQIVQKRVLEFVEAVTFSNSASPVQVPVGLSILQAELSSVTGTFMRLIAHNRAVFGEYYHEILTKLTNCQSSSTSS